MGFCEHAFFAYYTILSEELASSYVSEVMAAAQRTAAEEGARREAAAVRLQAVRRGQTTRLLLQRARHAEAEAAVAAAPAGEAAGPSIGSADVFQARHRVGGGAPLLLALSLLNAHSHPYCCHRAASLLRHPWPCVRLW